MSVFGSIMSKIFNHSAASSPVAAAAPPAATDSTTPPPPVPSAAAAPGAAFTEAAAPSQGAAPAGTSGAVDVGAILADMAAKSGERLNYKTSIVDLMKLLGLDSSLENRKALAAELHFTGDTGDSAAMNIWLHKQVMDQLAANSGSVPADLRG